MGVFSQFLSLIFPEKCLSCGKGETALCLPCALSLPRGFPPYKNTFVLYDYGDKLVKKAVWLLKYRNKRAIALIFAIVMRDSLLEELSELRLMKNFVSPILVPVPISAKRFRERGYNQAELIASELSRLGEFELNASALVKSRHTESQVKTQSRRERLKNLRGSFVVKNPDKIRGRNIILIDDVITTGATLSEARETLKKAGVKTILSVAVAH